MLGALFQTANKFPMLMHALLAVESKSLKKRRNEYEELTAQKLRKRVSLGGERPDLIEGFLRKRNELDMTFEKLHATTNNLIVAGSETTATLLSGVTYLLATNPDALQKLTEEIRTAFKTEEEIDVASVSSLPYMMACLEEGLRVYPPTPLGPPRWVPKGGGTIAGYFVPENVSPDLLANFHPEVKCSC